MAMLDSIAASLESAVRESAPPTRGVAVRTARPVLQLNRFPVTLDPAQYRNARSGSRPGGDLNPLFAFRELVDVMPAFTRNYSGSVGSIEKIYEALLTGASVDGDAPFAASVVGEARQRFASETFARSDGIAGVWRPVYATPDDWCDAGPERFQSIDIDLDALATDQSAFATIGSDEGLELRVGSDPATGSGSTGTKVRNVRIEYLLVGLRRSWLHPLLFETSDWFLSGQDAGFCSSGDLGVNDGVLPLVTNGLLLGRNIDVSADWSAADASRLNRAKSDGKPVSLGPFLLSSPGVADSTLQVIGWTSDLVPFSPKMTKNKAGSIHVDNMGGFAVRFSVEWNEGATRHEQHSGTFPVMAAKEIGLPVNATKILVTIDVMTAPWPLETWKTVSALPFDKPVVKKYVLSGVTLNPVLKEA
ncbi:hypothetical protein QTI66_28580 [Variovorax sp. J22R133]|uniref:hypothetical protein n=1 Tax=Variovorax brevis TaxID=3053503 RepID=UPI0025762385|nr:hypothetical protein [Variovorax sp. J22R133]MDM0116131.1 hypothetical protein [Variovorax sp. J22R133]